jgi:hypothetical protein
MPLPDTTLGKVFTDCDSQQRGVSELYISNDFFAETFCRAIWCSAKESHHHGDK